MNKKEFKIPGDQIQNLIPKTGGAYATDHITVEGRKIGYMYREDPEKDWDSGWRFFSGEEDQDYVDDPSNLAIYEVNTIANYDLAIIPYLDTPAPCAFERIRGTDEFRIIDL